MNITIAAPSFIPARRANTIQTMKMAQAFTTLGHHTILAVPKQRQNRDKNRPVESIHNKDAGSDWPYLAVHYGLKSKFPMRYFSAYPALRHFDFSLKVIRWARQNETQFLYTRLPQAAAIASQMNMPTILEIHDIPHGDLGPLLLRGFLAGKGAARLVVITRSLLGDLQRAYDFPSTLPFTLIAPDGVDLERYFDLPGIAAARKRLSEIRKINIPENRFVIGYTGHLYQGRGMKLMLELAERFPEMTFLAAGGEPEQIQELRKTVKSKDLGNFITAGFIPNAELPLYQACCDLLIMPYQKQVAASSGGDISRYLSPMKLFEYMACGRAILASDLPVFREVLNVDNAVLLPPQNVHKWESEIRGLSQDPHRRQKLAVQARKDAIKYSWDARAAKILEGL